MSLKKLLSALLVASMVFALVVPAAFAADSATDINQAVQLLKGFGIVKGDAQGNLNLDKTITRAELMTVMIRAAGKASDAELLKGAYSFYDVNGHWASGYIALAKAMGLTSGYPDGSFRPDAKVTYAEAITFLTRLVGLDVSKVPGSYPNNYIKAAVDAGLIPAGFDVTKVAGEYAIRGYVFALANTAFSSVKLASGKTIYQTYFKTTAPTVTVDQGATVSTAKDTVALSGSVSSDTVSLTVNGKAVAVSNGTFSFNASDLKIGDNTVTFVATDNVGNTGSASVKVSRAAGALTALVPSLTDSQNVTAGSVTAVTAAAKDSYGSTIPNAAVTVTAANGKVDDKGNYTAPQKVGTDTLTFTSGSVKATVTVNIVADKLAAINIAPANPTLGLGQGQKFTATGADQFGNTVAVSTVTWSASAGVIDQQGNFAGTVSGKTTITATANGVSGTSTVSVFGVPSAINLNLSKSTMVANGKSTTTATATVVDANGVAVGNYNGNITFTVTDTTVVGFAGSASTVTVTAVNGAATATLTSGSNTAASSAVVQATASGLAGGNATVTTNTQTLTSLSVSADPTTLAADNNSTTSISVKLLDQDGVQMKAAPSAGLTVTLASGTTNVADFLTGSGNPISFASGDATTSKSAALTAKSILGSTTVSVSQVSGAVTTLPSNSVTVSTSSILGANNLTIDTVSAASAAATVTDGSDVQTVTVRVRDINGNQVTGAAAGGQTSLKLTVTGASGTVQMSITPNAPANSFSNTTSAGPLSATSGKAVFYVKDNVAETLTFTAATQASNSGIASVTATGVINAGPAKNLILTTGAKTLAVGVGKTALSAKVVDVNGNAVSNGTYAVTFNRYNSVSPAALTWSGDQTVNTVNGVATITVAAGNYVNTTGDSIQATTTINGATTQPATQVQVNGTNYTAQQTITTAVIGPSAQLAFEGTAGNPVVVGSAAVGQNLTVKVDVLDGSNGPGLNQVVNTMDNSTVVTLTATDSTSNNVVSTMTATAAYGVATFKLNATTTNPLNLVASASSLKGAGTVNGNNPGIAAFTVGTGTQLSVKLSPATLGADGISAGVAQIFVADAYGNKITNNTNWTNLSVTDSSNGAVVKLAQTVNYYSDVNCSVAATVTGAVCATIGYTSTSSTGGTATLTASLTGNTTIGSTTATVTTVPVYAASKMNVAVDGNASANGGGTVPGVNNKQTVTVTLVDQNGNTVTAPNPAKVTLTASNPTGTVAFAGTNCVGTVVAGVAQGVATFTNGVATCTVTDTAAETLTYNVSYNANGGTTLTTAASTATATGTYVAGPLDHLVIATASPAYIAGNGSAIATVKVKLVDTATPGNTVTSVNGTATVNIDNGGDYGFLQGANSSGLLTVPVSNGFATVTIQSKSTTNNGTIGLKATFTSTDGQITKSAGPTTVVNVFRGSDANTALTGVVTTLTKTQAVFTFNQPLRTAPAIAASAGITPGTPSLDATGTVVTVALTGTPAAGNTVSIAAGAAQALNGLTNAAAVTATFQAPNGAVTTKTTTQVVFTFDQALSATPTITATAGITTSASLDSTGKVVTVTLSGTAPAAGNTVSIAVGAATGVTGLTNTAAVTATY